MSIQGSINAAQQIGLAGIGLYKNMKAPEEAAKMQEQARQEAERIRGERLERLAEVKYNQFESKAIPYAEKTNKLNENLEQLGENETSNLFDDPNRTANVENIKALNEQLSGSENELFGPMGELVKAYENAYVQTGNEQHLANSRQIRELTNKSRGKHEQVRKEVDEVIKMQDMNDKARKQLYSEIAQQNNFNDAIDAQKFIIENYNKLGPRRKKAFIEPYQRRFKEIIEGGNK